MKELYESHNYPDKQFPIIFHVNRVRSQFQKSSPVCAVKNDIYRTNRAHWHEGIELLRIFRGGCTVNINTEELQVMSGNTVVINSGDIHRISIDECDCYYDCLILNYSICAEWGFDPYAVTFNQVIKDSEIDALFDKIKYEFSKKLPHYKAIVSAVCMEIMARLTRGHIAKSTIDPQLEKKAGLVRNVMQYIIQNYQRPIELKEISEHLKYSHYYLSHIFSEVTGISIGEYLIAIRITEAEKLLTKTNLSVSEISQRCGYSNSAAFSTAFKKKCFLTPLEYRKTHRSNPRQSVRSDK